MARTEPESWMRCIRNAPQAVHRWAFITVTYNSAENIERFWSDVSFGAEVEWVVVDNASQDDSCGVAERLGARVIALPENRGFGAANNIGFRQTSAPYVCFVNPDVTPIVDDLEILASVIDEEPKRLVAPQLLNVDGTPQPNGRGEPSLRTKVMHRLAPERVADKYHRTARPGEVVQAEWLTGAVVGGKREWLELLGPWDERFFVYYEDSDLGLRNTQLCGTSVVVGDARWTHGWARETAGLNPSAWRRELSSLVKFYSRYPRLLGYRSGRSKPSYGVG